MSELILRYRQQSIQKSDHIDSGLIRYDRYLGWKLTRNWQGQHTHYDFTVNYSTNRYGFRGEFELNLRNRGARYAVLGDSFTFGYGVNDNETFVHLLNAKQKPEGTFLNFSIPGYSTDQELLLFRREVITYSPNHIVLIVYLGNDLYDNELPFPLQAENAKPFFELGPEGLILRNTPVPSKIKPFEQGKKDLQRVVFWDDFQTSGIVSRYLNRFILFRLLDLQLHPFPDLVPEFEKRYKYALQLFSVIIQEMHQESTQKQMALSLVLMPGKTFVKNPNSPISQAQNYLRREIVATFQQSQIEVIDLALLLRERYQKRPGKWFYPNEGHLTAEGHRIVADILDQYFHK